MAASDIAVNEQRYAAGIKNIVSTDSFADISDGNVGEFAKYLPGVTLNRSGSDGLSISIGGVPPSGTPIMMDGNGIASATGSNANRQTEFENIAVGSLARVEVSRSQNPDSPANAIGGSVNLISRKPTFDTNGYFSVGYGNLNRIDVSGALNVPLGTTVAARVAGADSVAAGVVAGAVATVTFIPVVVSAAAGCDAGAP